MSTVVEEKKNITSEEWLKSTENLNQLKKTIRAEGEQVLRKNRFRKGLRK